MQRDQLLDDGPLAPEWGPRPTAGQLRAARRVGDEAVHEAMHTATGRALTREQVAERLGVTPAQIAEAVTAGQLLELASGSYRRLPSWQFAGPGRCPAWRS